MTLKPVQAFAIVLLGYVALVVGLAFIFWPVALVVGGGILMGVGALVVEVAPDKSLDAAPLERIPE